MAAYRSSRCVAWSHNVVAAATSGPASRTPSSRTTPRTTRRTSGTRTPRKGSADFMYACWPGARDGSAAARSASRTAATRSATGSGHSEAIASLKVLLGRITAEVFSSSTA